MSKCTYVRTYVCWQLSENGTNWKQGGGGGGEDGR